MSDTRNYNVELPVALFPYAPGTPVVCRDANTEIWKESKFLFCFENDQIFVYDLVTPAPFLKSVCTFNQVHPMSTHGHLLGTTYPVDTPPPATIKNSEFQPFARVLVRDFGYEEWRCDIFKYKVSESICSYQCFCGRFTYCIPYEGNEYLLGTTDAPK